MLFGALSALMITAFTRGKIHAPKIVVSISLASIGAAFLSTWGGWLSGASISLGMLTFNRLTLIAWMIILLASGFTVLLSWSYLPSESRVRTEYYPLLLFSSFGLCILSSATDLVTIIIGIETTSLSAYTLVGIMRYQLRSNEASIKYFVIGSFSLAFFIMGIAFIFGSSGTTELARLGEQIPAILNSDDKWFFLFGCAMLMIGLAFKVAAVPFHSWVPDVYDGAPTPITAFIASALKTAAFIVFLRIAFSTFGKSGPVWLVVSSSLAIITMTLGNLAAIAQDNIKRLLAYSAIAHAGYMLVAFPILGILGSAAISAIIFYLVAYTLMIVGAFAVVVALNEGHEEHLGISSLAGLGKRRPWLAAVFTLFLLSLAGFPPTVGFFAKYYLFSAAVKSGLYWLAIVAVVNSAVSVYYYLRPVVMMYLRDDKTDDIPLRSSQASTSTTVIAVVFICALAVAFFGIFPTNLLDLILHSV